MRFLPRVRLLAGPATLVLAGLILAGCGTSTPPASAASKPIRLVDDTGARVVLKHPARRLVVLEPSNFEIVDELGIRSRVVGVDSSVPEYVPAPWHQAAQGLHSLGSVYAGVSAEKVLALKPDLVIADQGISGLSGLKALHIPVLTLEPKTVAGVYHDIRLVGLATGRSQEAGRVIARLKAEMARIEAKVRRVHTRPTVFYDLGGLYTAGPGNFINSLISLAGGRNVAARLSSTPWPQVTAEQVVAENPAVILVDPSGGDTVARELTIPGVSKTAAGKDHRVLLVPQPDYIDQPSPGVAMGLQELVQLLHPGLLH
jgi:iron complex transport system substrate-binding protein